MPLRAAETAPALAQLGAAAGQRGPSRWRTISARPGRGSRAGTRTRPDRARPAAGDGDQRALESRLGTGMAPAVAVRGRRQGAGPDGAAVPGRQLRRLGRLAPVLPGAVGAAHAARNGAFTWCARGL